MNDVILYTIITLGGIGAVSAVILYFVAQKFKVFEDPRIDEVRKFYQVQTVEVVDTLDVEILLRLV